MDYHGLVFKFPVNCPLTEWETRRRVHQNKPESVMPWGEHSVIKMNSTYLEVVDKFFGGKGFISAVCLMIIGIAVFFAGAMIFQTIDLWAERTPDNQRASLYLLAFVLVGFTGLIVWVGNGLRREVFSYTHYPIRFNRKNRMVYVTRINGTVMAESWDRLVFSQSQCGDDETRDIRGHRMAEDGETVLESFALPGGAGGEIASPYFFAFWEFARRYMEDGPKELMDKVDLVVDVEHRREKFTTGFYRLMLLIPSFLWPLMFPLILWLALGRLAAMQTSKIPHWPDEVEDECQIEADDPYLIDAEHLPEETDFSWWKGRRR